MVYCAGTNCSRRNQCAFHEHFEWKHLRQYLDWSTNGSAYGGFDNKGEWHPVQSRMSCGDQAEQYYHYKALGWREGEEYRNSIGGICDDVCVTCPHRSICYSILECAGMIFAPGDRVRFDCERIKADPEGKKEWLDRRLEDYYRRAEYTDKQGSE